jgi:hypothetical protein
VALFAKATSCFQEPRPCQPTFVEETLRHIGTSLNIRLKSSAHVNQGGRKATQTLCVLDPLLKRSPSATKSCSTSNLSVPWFNAHTRSECVVLASKFRSFKCCSPSVFALRLTHVCTLVTGKPTTIWGFHFHPPHQFVDRALTQKLVMLEAPYFRRLESVWTNLGLAEATHGSQGDLMPRSIFEVAPEKAAQWRWWPTLTGYPDCGFLHLSSVIKQMPGYNWKLARLAFPDHGSRLLKWSPSPVAEFFCQGDVLWFQLPDIHLNKVTFI